LIFLCCCNNNTQWVRVFETNSDSRNQRFWVFENFFRTQLRLYIITGYIFEFFGIHGCQSDPGILDWLVSTVGGQNGYIWVIPSVTYLIPGKTQGGRGWLGVGGAVSNTRIARVQTANRASRAALMNDSCSLKVEYSHEVCYPAGDHISNGAERDGDRDRELWRWRWPEL
jgi:hypothetical protein